ncbi:hypothetical protein BX591_111147 [Paraburkholderia bryophila]|uniref:Uncharacterized protein n=1 Tax=Paraburkholderia bryophila TaxID=420952 RepID=A0A329C464_9BURK|nr:hypothetical protein BX591_111147 [Paraburkholderia bryophila]
MEQSHMRVDACRPLTIKAKTLLLLELLLQKRLLHHINIYCLNCHYVKICCKNLRYRPTTPYHSIAAGSFAFNIS